MSKSLIKSLQQYHSGKQMMQGTVSEIKKYAKELLVEGSFLSEFSRKLGRPKFSNSENLANKLMARSDGKLRMDYYHSSISSDIIMEFDVSRFDDPEYLSECLDEFQRKKYQKDLDRAESHIRHYQRDLDRWLKKKEQIEQKISSVSIVP